MTSLKQPLLFLLFTVVLCWPTISSAQPKPRVELLQWKELPPLPDKVGFAGMVAGVSDNELLAAGGANFPDLNGPKVYHDTIYVLDKPDGKWKVAGKLKRPLAYAVSVTHNDRVICVGGENDTETYAKVFALKWSNNKIEIEDLEPLPMPCTNSCGALIGDKLYVAGGIREHSTKATKALKVFWSLDLSAPRDQQKWKKLPTWPGPERMLAVAASQSDKFFLFSGAQLIEKEGKPERIQPYLRDGYSFDPKKEKWTKLDTVMPRATVAAPGPAITLGQSHIVIIGGDDKIRPAQNHPGFLEDVLVYLPVTNVWTSDKPLSKGTSRVTAPIVQWKDTHVVISGEMRPRVRSPKVFSANHDRDLAFGWINWMVVVLYLAALLGMGYYFSLRSKGTEDFFLAGHRIPWWAAGLSIYGTQLSAITFMAIPAAAYLGNWVKSISNVTILLVAPVVIFCYLPFFRRLNVITAYEYLEKRFNLAIRWVGSLTFMVYHIGRMGIIFYLPSLALATATGQDVYACIGVLGVVCIVYTVMGGIEAVIWTDVLQVFVLLAGAVFCLVLIAGEMGGIGEMWSLAQQQDKVKIFDWGIGLDKPYTWLIFFGTIFFNLMPYTTDQTVVQRYLTTRDEKRAARGIWLNGILAIPTAILFFGLGTALFLFYQKNPTLLAPGKNDEIVPTYVVSQMPAGLAGLVIAGLFAAAMSSLDSSMNSIATAGVNDFYRRLKPEVSDEQALRLAKIITVIVGTVGTFAAFLLATLDVRSIFDLFFQVMGMIGGGLTGIFILGLFTRRAHALGVFCGAVAGLAAPLAVKLTTNVDGFLFGAIGVLSCVIVGWTASVLLPGSRKDLTGLTLRSHEGHS